MDHLTWRRSSYSSPQGGNCVEVADLDDSRAIQDSKDRTGPALMFTVTQWAAFTTAVSTGQLD